MGQEHFVDNDAIEKSGPFLQIIKNNTDRIGCSIVTYFDLRNYTCTLFGCNYNVGNFVANLAVKREKMTFIHTMLKTHMCVCNFKSSQNLKFEIIWEVSTKLKNVFEH